MRVIGCITLVVADFRGQFSDDCDSHFELHNEFARIGVLHKREQPLGNRRIRVSLREESVSETREARDGCERAFAALDYFTR